MLMIRQGEPLGYQGGTDFIFDALSCSEVRNIAAYSSQAYCDPEKIVKETSQQELGKEEMLTIIQKDASRIFKGFKCTKRKSVITALCGMFSHSKLQSPMDILMPQTVTMSECQAMRDTRIYRTEDGKAIQVHTGGGVTYKYVEAGAVMLS